MPTIKGNITDQYGQPAARIVRLYRRDTGAYLGETSSAAVVGNYGDPHFDEVSLLLHMDGGNGSTAFTDSSGTPKALTAYNGAALSTAQSRWGGASAYFPGARGNRLVIPAGDHFNFGAGDFAIEAWIYVTSLADNRTIISQYGFSGNRSWDLLVAGGRAHFRCTSGGTTDIVGVFTPALQDERWYHVAVTRSGNVFSIFLDGVLTESQSSASPVFSSTYTAAIGYNQEGAWPFAGYIDDLRITKGAARYTADFTPPAAPHPATQYVRQNALGEYYLSTPYTGEVQRIVLDSRTLGDPTKLNDLVDRVFLI